MSAPPSTCRALGWTKLRKRPRAFTLYLTEFLKIPVSTTHTITGAIIGVGATKRLSAVRWGVTRSLMTAWVLTIPVSGLLAAGVYWVITLLS